MTERLTDEALTDEGLAAFAAYFRRNYPGPDTIIGNPDWHAPRLYRAALDAHRRAAPADDLRAENERLRAELEAIATSADDDDGWTSDGHERCTEAARAALSQKGGDA